MTEPHTKAASVIADVGSLRIARVYAEALLNVAEKQGQADAILGELDSLVDDVFSQSPQLEVLFSSAAVGRHVRTAAIDKAFASRVSDILVNFLQVLNDHERLDLIRAIRHVGHQLNDERRRRLRIFVQSAVPLPDDFRSQLVERIGAAYQMEPILEDQIVPDLLGGMKIRIKDLQVDATISTYLDNLKKTILARSSHAIQSRRDRFSSANGD
jgi:F-type H+-transporting ATPase subunit delta